MKPVPYEGTLSPVLSTLWRDCPSWHLKRLLLQLVLWLSGFLQTHWPGMSDLERHFMEVTIRRFWCEVWRQDPPPRPVRSGSGEAISVEKENALLQSDGKSGKTRCMLARGNENAGLVLAFMRWWAFCSPHFSQVRWDFILEQPRLLFWSPKHIHCWSTEMLYNWMGLPILRLAFLSSQVQWMIPLAD